MRCERHRPIHFQILLNLCVVTCRETQALSGPSSVPFHLLYAKRVQGPRNRLTRVAVLHYELTGGRASLQKAICCVGEYWSKFSELHTVSSSLAMLCR